MSTVLLLNLSISNQKPHYWDFPGGPGVKSPDCHAGDAGSIPGQGTKIPHALCPKNENIKQNQYYNTFNNDF